MEGNNSQVFQEILEAVNFIKDNAVNKEDFNRLETRFDGLETRFDGLETRFDSLENKFIDLEIRLDSRIDKIEGRFNRRIDELEDKMNDRFDGFIGMYKKIDTEVTSLKSAYGRLEQKLEGSH